MNHMLVWIVMHVLVVYLVAPCENDFVCLIWCKTNTEYWLLVPLKWPHASPPRPCFETEAWETWEIFGSPDDDPGNVCVVRIGVLRTGSGPWSSFEMFPVVAVQNLSAGAYGQLEVVADMRKVTNTVAQVDNHWRETKSTSEFQKTNSIESWNSG